MRAVLEMGGDLEVGKLDVQMTYLLQGDAPSESPQYLDPKSCGKGRRLRPMYLQPLFSEEFS